VKCPLVLTNQVAADVSLSYVTKQLVESAFAVASPLDFEMVESVASMIIPSMSLSANIEIKLRPDNVQELPENFDVIASDIQLAPGYGNRVAFSPIGSHG